MTHKQILKTARQGEFARLKWVAHLFQKTNSGGPAGRGAARGCLAGAHPLKSIFKANCLCILLGIFWIFLHCHTFMLFFELFISFTQYNTGCDSFFCFFFFLKNDTTLLGAPPTGCSSNWESLSPPCRRTGYDVIMSSTILVKPNITQHEFISTILKLRLFMSIIFQRDAGFSVNQCKGIQFHTSIFYNHEIKETGVNAVI